MLSDSRHDLDRRHLIHPVSSWQTHGAHGGRIIASGEGGTMTDSAGHTLVDAFAGLWCVNAGYGQPSVIAAATRQMEILSYATG